MFVCVVLRGLCFSSSSRRFQMKMKVLPQKQTLQFSSAAPVTFMFLFKFVMKLLWCTSTKHKHVMA